MSLAVGTLSLDSNEQQVSTVLKQLRESFRAVAGGQRNFSGLDWRFQLGRHRDRPEAGLRFREHLGQGQHGVDREAAGSPMPSSP